MKKKRQWFMCLGMIGVFTASVIPATSFQQNAPAASFGYSSGSAEDFEEVSEDEEDLPF